MEVVIDVIKIFYMYEQQSPQQITNHTVHIYEFGFFFFLSILATFSFLLNLPTPGNLPIQHDYDFSNLNNNKNRKKKNIWKIFRKEQQRMSILRFMP